MKKACIAFAQGCPRSMMDASRLIEYFKKNEWEITANLRKADVILVATCGFTLEHEDKSLKFLSIAEKKKKKNARLIAFGCLPGINEPRILEKSDAMPITRGTFDRLDEVTEAKVPIAEIGECNDLDVHKDYLYSSFNKFQKLFINYDNPLHLANDLFDRFNERNTRLNDDEKLFNLRVGSGCNGLCTYCAIKNAVGPLTSKPLDRVMKEFETGLSQGYKTFRLIADDVGAYGQDNGTNVADLLRALFDSDADFKVTFDDFSPKWLIQYFSELSGIFCENEKRLGILGLPVQSGSENMLDLMKREYSAEDSKKCMAALESALPGVRMDTHVVIGFPGEEESDFQDTLEYLKYISFNRIFVYKYSERPGTEAINFPHKVPEKIKKERIARLERAALPSELYIDYKR